VAGLHSAGRLEQETKALILHADMDAFFAAVEQRDRPELMGVPVIVGGTSARGVVSTASYEARVYGVHSAMPMQQARELCPRGVFLSGRMSVYRAESEKVFEVFERFSPCVEALSLDEAFLDIAGCERLLGTPECVAHDLRAAVYRATGLRVSVGGAPSKSVAKIASDLAKPDGVRIVLPEEVAEFLAPLPISRIWGLGRLACKRLEAIGVRSIGELRTRSESELRRCLGSSALRAKRLAHGDDPRRVEPDRERKSFGEETTFGRDLAPGPELRAVVCGQAEAVARRLRQAGRASRRVTLKLKLGQRLAPGRYRSLTRSSTLPRATDDGRELRAVALELLRCCEELAEVRRFGVRLAGVAAARLEPCRAGSLDLFAEPARERRSQLNRAVDAVRSRFGENALQLGGERPRTRLAPPPSRGPGSRGS